MHVVQPESRVIFQIYNWEIDLPIPRLRCLCGILGDYGYIPFCFLFNFILATYYSLVFLAILLRFVNSH